MTADRSTQARYQTIEAMSAQYDLTDLCAAFDVTRGGYHAWLAAEPSEREQTDAALRRRACPCRCQFHSDKSTFRTTLASASLAR